MVLFNIWFSLIIFLYIYDGIQAYGLPNYITLMVSDYQSPWTPSYVPETQRMRRRLYPFFRFEEAGQSVGLPARNERLKPTKTQRCLPQRHGIAFACYRDADSTPDVRFGYFTSRAVYDFDQNISSMTYLNEYFEKLHNFLVAIDRL